MKVDIVVNDISYAKSMSDELCEQALEKCGQVYENYASDYAPVDTGRLQNSIEHHPEGHNTMVIETDVEYAVYQELGTSRQTGKPYMRPAGLNHLKEYISIIQATLGK